MSPAHAMHARRAEQLDAELYEARLSQRLGRREDRHRRPAEQAACQVDGHRADRVVEPGAQQHFVDEVVDHAGQQADPRAASGETTRRRR